MLSPGWAGSRFPASSRLSFRHNPKHPERSLHPAGTGPVACPVHVAGSARGGSKREVLIYLTSLLWRRQAEMRTLRPAAKKSLVQVTSWELLGAQLGRFWCGPDLRLVCFSTPVCMKRAGRTRKRGGTPSGDPAALDLGARLSKKQAVTWGDTSPFLSSLVTLSPLLSLFKKKKRFYLFLERREGRERGRETLMSERYIESVASASPKMGTWPVTQACALTGN